MCSFPPLRFTLTVLPWGRDPCLSGAVTAPEYPFPQGHEKHLPKLSWLKVPLTVDKLGQLCQLIREQLHPDGVEPIVECCRRRLSSQNLANWRLCPALHAVNAPCRPVEPSSLEFPLPPPSLKTTMF